MMSTATRLPSAAAPAADAGARATTITTGTTRQRVWTGVSD
ncbi:hypothetical protein [Luteimonas rhizosphaerae]|nr:hypothetical protein [Luteimonas sp. 4-12]